MQLTYNNQSLLATGCYEEVDTGVTRFGKQVITEMNRVGLVIDMSHSAERSTLEAIQLSDRPIAITHANPSWWHPALRNKSHELLSELTDAGGMLGFSLYPHHLKDSSECTVASFCEMVAESANRYGIGISVWVQISVRISLTVLLPGCVTVAGPRQWTTARVLRRPLDSRTNRLGSVIAAISTTSLKGWPRSDSQPKMLMQLWATTGSASMTNRSGPPNASPQRCDEARADGIVLSNQA